MFLIACGSRSELGVYQRKGQAPDAAPDGNLPPGCDVADSTILLLEESGDLHRFNPLSLEVAELGKLSCRDEFNSMTVSRSGTLYLNSTNGELYTADPGTLGCQKTRFDASQVQYERFGMGFVADDVPSGESLYIAPQTAAIVVKLATIELPALQVRDVARLPQSVPAAEVKGTGDGRLYLFHVATGGQDAQLIEIDKRTAAFGAAVNLALGQPFRGFDFAFWGGAFYVFSSLWGESTARVIRYWPDLGTLEELGRIPVIVVGAAVSTCAPL